MIAKTTNDVVKAIADVIQPLFHSKGFALKNDKYFEYADPRGFVFQYEINLTKNKGYFHLHLMLNVYNQKLMNQVNEILKLVLRDNKYEYPPNWDKKQIESSAKARLKNKLVYSLTDWRSLKRENEKLAEFNARFSIWFCVFDDLDEIKDWRDQLIESVGLASDWFLKTNNDEWIISNTEYPALYLLNEQGRFDELKDKSKEILARTRLKREVELFINYLENQGMGVEGHPNISGN